MVESAVIVITVKYFFEVDEKVCLACRWGSRSMGGG